jgi:MerR family transcriptional regulator, light-induced transcriptional regulator
MALRAQGTPLDVVFLRLFAPSARYLGELWQEDICDFADVTIALSLLQQLLRELVPDGEVEPRPGARRALLVAAPGEQHTFGIFIVQEFFRRAGWQVCGGFPSTIEELVNVAASEPFDVVGLSVSCDASVERLTTVIRTIRRCASNPAFQMMVGGRFFLEHPEFVTRIGADATAPDGRRAVPQLSSLLDTKAMRY